MRVKARKRYWLVNVVAALVLVGPTHGIILLLLPLIWLLDKKLAMAAYKREELGLPPSWYDGFSKWEFERINATN